MKDLTLSQEYLICAVNEKGTLGAFSTEKQVCLVAAALLELRLAGCVALEKKTVTVTAPLPAEQAHLAPLYHYLTSGGKDRKLEKLLEDYHYSVTDTRLNDLLGAIGSSLAALDLARPVKAGLLGGKMGYLPTREAINGVVDLVRAELLEEGEVTEDVAALVILLDKGKSLKPYFSAFEQKEMKEKIQAIGKTPTGKLVREMVEYVENLISIMATLVVVFS